MLSAASCLAENFFGESTYIWSEKWIVDTCPRQPVNKEMSIEVNRKVNTLINENREWSIEELNRLFPVNGVKRIQKSQSGRITDRNIWAVTDHGSYTVKSGY